MTGLGFGAFASRTNPPFRPWCSVSVRSLREHTLPFPSPCPIFRCFLSTNTPYSYRRRCRVCWRSQRTIPLDPASDRDHAPRSSTATFLKSINRYDLNLEKFSAFRAPPRYLRRIVSMRVRNFHWRALETKGWLRFR